MKITNQFGAPQLIYEFLKQDFYDHEEAKDTLSITTLIKPIQQIILTERYWDEIEVDCQHLFWSVLGSGVHAVLDKVDCKNLKPVERLFTEIEGAKVSGKFDVIRGKKLSDYKVTSAWSLVYGGKFDDWIAQLSGYRWLYAESKKIMLEPVGSIIAIFRDWRLNDTSKEGYPKFPLLELDMKLWKLEDTKKFYGDKVKEVLKYRKTKDKFLPPCTDEETWLNKKSGIRQNCENYCYARAFCQQKKRQERVSK